jgi:hypothetical protein|tara:strand:+ start:506 stop:667 length:162 start_codon:yes stop_codon:yes gene_type:complete
MKSNQIEQDIENMKHDMLKMMDKIDIIEQSLINLKWLLKIEKAKMPNNKKQKS